MIMRGSFRHFLHLRIAVLKIKLLKIKNAVFKVETVGHIKNAKL